MPFCQSTDCLRWILADIILLITELYSSTNFADEERFELSTIGLTSAPSGLPLSYSSDVDLNRFELLQVGLEDQCTSIMLQVIHLTPYPLQFVERGGWPGEIRTHNPPVKSRVHLIQLSYEPILLRLLSRPSRGAIEVSRSFIEFVMTDRFELSTFTVSA